MQLTFISLTVALAAASSLAAPANGTESITRPVADLGINCLGSSLCKGRPSNTAAQLAGYISNAPSGAWYNNGEQIACVRSICAFLQNSGGAPGSSVKALAQHILAHGCTACGSVPLFYPNDNDVRNGQLTFNYVINPRCPGLC
ncbi:Kp4-domain-containing protein [Mycena crocata]|nr:Kp4-domain-containing protein [Mycena crocata]